MALWRILTYTQTMKVVFFGTSKYCLPVLDVLNSNFELKLVVTRPDKPVGRKKILTPSATKIWAEKNNIPVGTNLSNLLTYCPTVDLGLVADFGQIIPENIFNIPRLSTFNVHFSKLPDLRGASPIQSAILHGDTTAWVTIFKLEKTLDTGPILWQKSYPIEPTETAEDLYIRLFQEVARELPNIDFSGPLTPQEGQPTFCKKLSREDGFIEWENIENPANYNKYRAFYPWPGIWSVKDNKRVKIIKCHIQADKLVLDQIQFEGEKPQLFSDKLIS